MRARFFWLIAIWGCSFLLIHIGLEALAPLQVVLARTVFGALALLGLAAARRAPLPREPAVWAKLAVTATLLNTIPFSLMAYAEQRIPSAIASICNATTPLFTLLVALVALPDERPTAMRGLGLVLGFAGVVVVFGAWDRAAAPDPWGIALVLGASLCYGLGGVYLRRSLSRTRYSGVALSAGQISISALQLALVTPLVTAMPSHVPVHVALAVIALGMFGTGIAYALNYDVIRVAGATAASTVTYCIPVVSIGLGIAVASERLTWNAPLGASIIITGALLSRMRGGRVAIARGACAVAGERAGWVRGLS